MDTFEALQAHFQKTYGNMGTPVYLDRPKGRGRVQDGEVVNTMRKDNMEEAKTTLRDHGFREDSDEYQEKLQDLLEGIRRRKAEKGSQSTEKAGEVFSAFQNLLKVSTSMERRGEGGGSNPGVAKRAWGIIFRIRPDLKGDNRAQPGWTPGSGDKPRGSNPYLAYQLAYTYVESGERGPLPEEIYHLLGKQPPSSVKTGVENAIQNMQKAHISPALANLLSAAAGWALSADVASKEIPPHMAQEWERTLSHRDKVRLQEEMIRKLRNKVRKSDDGPFLEQFEILYKDHAPVPPRQGLMFDPVKHRWTRPEKIGRTVWEVQGHKRFRGTGTGAHERGRSQRGHGGYGQGRSEAGSRFRSTGDVGRLHPHEAKHPGQTTLLPLKRRKKTERRKHAKKK